MPHLDFTAEDVEAKAGVKPWKRRTAFREEIKPDHMADTAAVYARAAGEADDAGDLAERATEVAGEAGSLDGSSLVATRARIDETARGLQGNGRDIDAVVGLIVRSMNRAIEGVDEVDMVIDAPQNGLDAILRAHQRDAVNEWNDWVRLRNEGVSDAVGAIDPTLILFSQIHPITLSHRGDSVTLAPLPSLPGGPIAWEDLPDSLAARVRNRHIAATAEAAKAADEQITDAISAYRTALVGYAGELGEKGYDLDAGPFALFTNPQMADFVADRLHDELNSDSPDPNVVKMYTEGLAAVLDGIVAEDGSLVPGAKLTGAQRDYLSTVLGALTADDLAALGRFDPGTGLGNPMAAGVQNAVLERVANAVNLLTDPAAGGYDVSTDEGWQKVPEGFRDMLTLARNTEPTDPIVHHIGDWNAFGALMAHADHAPSDGWGRRVAESALEMQHTTMNQYLQSMVNDVEANTGSSDLLGMVALNSGLSADLLNDKEFRTDLMEARWEDSSGAAELITSGTTIPAGVHHNDAGARPYISAAYHLFQYAGSHPDSVLGESHLFNTERFDHTALQSAFGDTLLRYMDPISQLSGPEGNHLGDKDKNLFGNDYDYSFDLGMDTRESLFQMMWDAGGQASVDFGNGIAEWTERRTAESLARTGGELSQASDFENIGSVNGTWAQVQANDGLEDKSKQHFTAMSAVGLAGTVANTAMEFGKANIITSAVAFGVQEAMRYGREDGAADLKDAQWDLNNMGDIPMRVAVANGVLLADIDGAAGKVDKDDLERLNKPDVYGLDDSQAAAVNIGSKHIGSYINALEDGYNQAVRDDLTAN
ncbi:hypothetical protein [Streptomyces sp. NPDC049879]|uniref:hypothetical protein n=1 Tax=Streptomyces sp. NPDC049879 TaxID=3365598 RepID=UPI0037A0EB59